MLSFYIAISTLVAVGCIYWLSNPGPSDNNEALKDGLLMFLLIAFWPAALIVCILAFTLRWISGE